MPHKKLGQEPGKHWMMFEANGPSALVENAKDLGWQIRTLTNLNWNKQPSKTRRALKRERERKKQNPFITLLYC